MATYRTTWTIEFEAADQEDAEWFAQELLVNTDELECTIYASDEPVVQQTP